MNPDQYLDYSRQDSRLGRLDIVGQHEQIDRDNAVKEAAARAIRIPVGIQGVEGNQQVSHESPAMLARITRLVENDGSYEFIRVRRASIAEQLDGSPPFVDCGEAGYGLEGSLTIAFETAGATNVPVDGSAIVELRQSDAEYGFEFTWEGTNTIWARLDEYGDPVGDAVPWAWTEMQPDASGGFIERDPGLSGTLDGTTNRASPRGRSSGCIAVLARDTRMLKCGWSKPLCQRSAERSNTRFASVTRRAGRSRFRWARRRHRASPMTSILQVSPRHSPASSRRRSRSPGQARTFRRS